MTKTIEHINDAIAKAKVNGENTKLVSDTNHSFAELYEQRAYLFAALLRSYPDVAFKSLKHDDGTMFNGDFIAGLKTPMGQYTFHFKLNYWPLFRGVKEVEFAPKYDGHTPADIGRVLSLIEEVSR